MMIMMSEENEREIGVAGVSGGNWRWMAGTAGDRALHVSQGVSKRVSEKA